MNVYGLWALELPSSPDECDKGSDRRHGFDYKPRSVLAVIVLALLETHSAGGPSLHHKNHS